MDSETSSKIDWNAKSYIADRSRGGLVFTRAPAVLEECEREELEENCLELISKDAEQLCILVYPLKDGQYVVSSAQKVQGTKREPRRHDVVHGVILNENELELFCGNILAEGKVKEFFFPEQMKTKEKRAEEDTVQMDVAQEWNVQKLIDQMERAPKGHALEEVLLAALIQMSVAARLSLSFLSGGETTVCEPNILLAGENELEHMEQNSYEVMNFGQFLSCFRQRRGPRWQNAPEREKWQKELLDLCEDYLNDELLEYQLYQKVGQLKRKDRDLFLQFQMELRVMLTGICGKKKYQNRYMELVHLAFKKDISAEECMSAEFTQAPYDYAKMIAFLQKKAVTKTEEKRLMMKMLEVPFDECLGRNIERTARKAARSTVRNYIR